MALQIDNHGRVRVLRFDRPDRLNALDAQHYGLIADALDAAAADDAVGVLVFTGTGRAFCAGADLRALKVDGRATGVQFDRMLDSLAIDKPLIAAVNGLAVGIGTTILLHCDIVLADPAARFRTPFAPLGTAPEAGSSYLLAQRTNTQFANLMLLGGDWIDAPTALHNHLIAAVSAPDATLDEALALAQRIAEHSPAALAAAKRLVAEGTLAASRAARVRETQEAARLGADGLLNYLK
ncbi:MAG: enoyl-CoA hydratase-related protein [Actinomycetota bacterium]|nr:enoyl-CoA hydratase-related protein [Actinomycetota bacterium]